MHAHGTARDTDAVLIEIRQDLLEREDETKTIIDALVEILGRFAEQKENVI